MQMLGISGACFEPPIAEDESHEERRYAELSEVMYIALGRILANGPGIGQKECIEAPCGDLVLLQPVPYCCNEYNGHGHRSTVSARLLAPFHVI